MQVGRGLGKLAAGLMLIHAAPLPAELYILAGQSNMSGRGDPAGLTAAERSVDPHIRLYGNDGRWRAALDPLDGADGQIDPVSADRQAAVGPGLFFARALLRSRRMPVALVPCAKGGSTIARWRPGGDRSTLYGSCTARVAEAGGRPAGMLWYQGESDAERSPAEAAGWSIAFRAMIDAFRRDLGAPRLPVVVVQIAEQPRDDADRYPAWALIRAQQAGSLGRCVTTVAAGGLPRNPDDLHLSTAAHRELGPRLAAAMAKLHRQGCR